MTGQFLKQPTLVIFEVWEEGLEAASYVTYL